MNNMLHVATPVACGQPASPEMLLPPWLFPRKARERLIQAMMLEK